MLNELEQKIRKEIPELDYVLEIQLNHVLEYVYKSKTYQNSEIGQDDYIIERVCRLWNLKSNLLSEQSEELIKFVNEL